LGLFLFFFCGTRCHWSIFSDDEILWEWDIYFDIELSFETFELIIAILHHRLEGSDFVLSEEIDIEIECLELSEEYIERLWDIRTADTLPLHDSFVELSTAIDVIGLDREHLLENIGCTVSFESPHFHFSETLTSVLSLSSEWLLCHHRVWTDRSSMDLVFDEMVELEHILDSDHSFLLECITRLSVVELYFTICWESCLCHEIRDLICCESIEDRSCYLDTELASSTTEMRLEDLTDVHTRDDTERIEDDIDWSTISHEWHIFDWHYS
jgi:hypothetical protein